MQEIVPIASMGTVGQIANHYASQNVFVDYQARIAANTLRRQRDDLSVFAAYLGQIGVIVEAEDLFSAPDTWSGISHGLVAGFVQWMLLQGYAIGSVNVRLSTVKAYCKLCARAGVLSTEEYALIKMVQGYKHSEARNVDQRRERVRKGPKKADSVSISKEQAERLKSQPDTPQGARDALLMCLLLDHGLRCGEIAALKPGDLRLSEGLLFFYREKVDKHQLHQLTSATQRAAARYLAICTPGPRLLLGSQKGGALSSIMSTRAITKRVEALGRRVGLVGLSAHDCRHYWTTSAIKGGTDIKSLQDGGGWKSPAMILRYAESHKIANEGVKLG